MYDNDYTRLVEFMTREFSKIENRLDKTATKDDLKPFATKDDLNNGLKDVKRHNEILIEDVKHGIQAIVDGQKFLNEKLDRESVEFVDRFARLDKFDMHLMSDIDDHEVRIKTLEKKS